MWSIQAAVAYLRARSVRTLRDPANLRARSVRTWKRCTWSSSTITKASNSRDKRIHLVAGSTIISSLWKRCVWSIEHNHYLRSSLLTDTILCCSQFEQLGTSSRDIGSRKSEASSSCRGKHNHFEPVEKMCVVNRAQSLPPTVSPHRHHPLLFSVHHRRKRGP